jgi:hypothetical protein
MTFWYTARDTYSPTFEDGTSWTKYIKWSRLTQLKELVSLDSILCGLSFDADYEQGEIYQYAIIDDGYTTDLFNSLDYVFRNVESKSNFNLLAVVKEPNEDCKNLHLADFDFVGYDLIDTEYNVSALTNCGGFDETFSPEDLNERGLIDEHSKAFDIRMRLIENYPEEHHADCNVFGLWRHKTLGKAKL